MLVDEEILVLRPFGVCNMSSDMYLSFLRLCYKCSADMRLNSISVTSARVPLSSFHLLCTHLPLFSLQTSTATCSTSPIDSKHRLICHKQACGPVSVRFSIPNVISFEAGIKFRPRPQQDKSNKIRQFGGDNFVFPIQQTSSPLPFSWSEIFRHWFNSFRFVDILFQDKASWVR